jgi:O-methyltransferase
MGNGIKIISKVAPTWKFKVGRFLKSIIFGMTKSFLFFLAQIFFSWKIDPSKNSIIIPEFTYSPWLADEEFQKIWPNLKVNTRVDEYKGYSLWELVEQVRHIEGDLLEVGVWRGGSGCLLAYKCHIEKIGAKVYLCDTYEGVVKAGERDPVFKGGEVADTSTEIVENLLKRYHLDNFEILKGIFPEDTGHYLENKKFRLCHIDVDVYQSAKDTLDWVWGKMDVGGVVVFDDYGHNQCLGITELVQEEGKNPDRIVIHNLSGHAIMIKIRNS